MEQNRFRCHVSMLFKNMGGVLAFLALGVINKLAEIMGGAQETEATGGEMLLAVLFILGLCLVLFIYNLFIWRNTWIQIDGTSVVIEKNTWNRKVNTIGIANISNVNLTQNIIQRLIGVYEVKLDTNSATTADETDVHIILGEKKAHWMRDEIWRLGGRTSWKDTEAVTGEVQPEMKSEEAVTRGMDGRGESRKISYSFKDVLLHCVYGWSVFSILFLLAMLVLSVLGIRNLVADNMLEEAVTELGGIFVLLLGLAGGIWKMVQSAIRYYGFEVERTGGEIRVHYGLLQHKEYLIPVEKISAVRIRQSLIARIAGRKSLELICVGLGDDENEETAILLSAKASVLEEQVQEILPEYTRELYVKLICQPKRALLAGVSGMLWMLVVVAFVTGVVTEVFPEYKRYLLAGGVGVYVWYLICKVLAHVARRMAVGENCVILVEGIFQLQTILIPYDKIQYIEISQGIIARHLGMSKGDVHILASFVQSTHESGYFPEDMLENVHRKIL